ncbi:hypothetical protein DEA8626_00147 [Defluviimonas aquaemixtae]|uniref:N-acetyltransferase domain-containing protein n=1 Tax=Albidovulum aquaemixtae TaxID=1542388 RepID=A0A2R8B243_9RHOB|nr:GNAT family N-acetyltransferase [Defluviimonas aquaemixtae]SPH16637.1 hypothetical protein DEA8626_00147 [Defluviimonas aquaemixtae]
MTGADVHIPSLTTERLILRCPVREDFEPFAAILASPRARLMGGPFDRSGAWSFFASDLASWHLDGYGGWSVTDRASGHFLGQVAIAKPARFPETELGWCVTEEAEGKGIAFEAAETARRWGFAVRGLETLVSYIDPANARSIALAERLGAVRDDAAERADPDDLVYRHPVSRAA